MSFDWCTDLKRLPFDVMKMLGGPPKAVAAPVAVLGSRSLLRLRRDWPHADSQGAVPPFSLKYDIVDQKTNKLRNLTNIILNTKV